jgi:hypothetical protein
MPHNPMRHRMTGAGKLGYHLSEESAAFDRIAADA